MSFIVSAGLELAQKIVFLAIFSIIPRSLSIAFNHIFYI